MAEAQGAQSSNVTTISLRDGRKVDFAGKRKMLKDIIVDGSKVSVRFDFRNGETLLIPIPDQHLLYSAGHGYAQKLGDQCAGLEDVDDMVLEVDDLATRLASGPWTMQREGGGFGGTSVLLRALVELTSKTVEQVKEFLSGKSQAEKMALRASARVKPIVDRLEAEKASKGAKVDTDALLAQLS